MIIRKGTDKDIPAMSLLWLQMVRELAPQYTPNVAWWVQMAFNLYHMGNYHFIVAEREQDNLAGFLDFFIYPEPATGKKHAAAQHFFVAPEWRKTMIAGQIYRMAIKTAKLWKPEAMELFSFPNQMNFWGKHNYTPVRIMMRKEMSYV